MEVSSGVGNSAAICPIGDAQTKREILSTLSSLNCTLKDHLLSINKVEWLVPIEEQYPAIKTAFEAFELENNQDPQRRKEVFTSLSPLMRGLVDEVRTAIEKNDDLLGHIPYINAKLNK